MKEILENTLPNVIEYIEHEESHGIIYSDNQGSHCSKAECIINKNPLDLNPIFRFLDLEKQRKKDKSKKDETCII